MMRRAMKLFPKGLVVGSASLGLTYVYKNRINQEIKNRQPLAAYVSSQCEGGSNSTKKTDKKPREISIDTPWGKMAGKHWPRKTETSKTPENNSEEKTPKTTPTKCQRVYQKSPSNECGKCKYPTWNTRKQRAKATGFYSTKKTSQKFSY